MYSWVRNLIFEQTFGHCGFVNNFMTKFILSLEANNVIMSARSSPAPIKIHAVYSTKDKTGLVLILKVEKGCFIRGCGIVCSQWYIQNTGYLGQGTELNT